MYILLTLLAQVPTGLGGNIGGPGLGPFGLVNWGSTGDVAGQKLGGVISAIVGLLTVVAGIWFIFQFITGALQWLASGGDKNGLQQAQQKISNSLLGLVIVVAAIAIIKLIGTFLGFDILNPASFINAIQFK